MDESRDRLAIEDCYATWRRLHAEARLDTPLLHGVPPEDLARTLAALGEEPPVSRQELDGLLARLRAVAAAARRAARVALPDRRPALTARPPIARGALRHH